MKEDSTAPVPCTEQPNSLSPQLRRERSQSPCAPGCALPGQRAASRLAQQIRGAWVHRKSAVGKILISRSWLPGLYSHKFHSKESASLCHLFFFFFFLVIFWIIKSPLAGDDPSVHSQASEPGQGRQGIGGDAPAAAVPCCS